MHILIVEDDPSIATNVCDYLLARGHTVNGAADGLSGLHLAVTQRFDAIVLDISLPRMDGITICTCLRDDAASDTPILMLTARDTLEDKLLAFESGADDFVVKPFALAEVEARLSALCRRVSGRVPGKVLCRGDLSLDPLARVVYFCAHRVKLQPMCMRLLELMLQEPERVFSRAQLEKAVWGIAWGTSDTLHTHIYVLRRALVSVGGYDPIQTVRGVGYRLLTHKPD